jgi:CARDB
MKFTPLTTFAFATAIAACVVATSSVAQTPSPSVPGGGIQAAPKGGGLQHGPAASWPSLKRADLTAEGLGGVGFGFRIRNVGTGDTPATTTLVTCTAVSAAATHATQVPCVQGTHYLVTPVMPPPGTVASGNTWKVPTPALPATTGQFTFTLGVTTTPQQRARGLIFKVCADASNAINELNEGNNCYTINYYWPN